ncbi:MAG: VWA domain-containing protein [Acidobacteria bacterium]|nr:VWA domain-containing protein [Acidobacteriota bacterium]
MKNKRCKLICAAAVACAAVGLWILGVNPMAHAQQPGPTPNAGETVYAPKKSAKPNLQQQPQNQPSEQPEKVPQQPGQPAPQEKQPQKINPNQVYTLSTQSNLVNVDVLVTDNNGDPITGLTKKNFKVLDDGVPQSVTNFSTAEAPITVTMLIEFSNKWWGFLSLALEDAYQFLNFMEPKDWVAVVDFDMQPHILQDFTHDRYQVRSALDSLRLPGFSETNLYDALAFTVDRMKNVGGRKAILAIVTGFDSFSKLTYGQMLKIAKGSNTPIYPVSILEWVTIRYGESIDTVQARNALTSIARNSGGQAYFPRFEGALPDIYQQIAGQLRHEYSLGFVPTDNTKNGKFHKLQVKLVDAQGNPLIITNKKGKKIKYRVVAREGYYAPKA